jgi:nitrate reductase molybdenum cofactor assembly chaperone
MNIHPIQAAGPTLARLLDYPERGWRRDVERARHLLAEHSIAASELVYSFQRELDGMTLSRLQELYSRTFDLSPVCIPYVSVHLFGEESFKRAGLMSGLAEVYRRHDCEADIELPDHLGVILRHAPCFDAGEWDELLRYCLRPAVEPMVAALARGANPYRHVVGALRAALAVESATEHADA